MAIKTVDFNKGTIMKMLHTDVFGFDPDRIEKASREAYDLVVNGGEVVESSNLAFSDVYGRNKNGYILVTNKTPTKGKKKK